MARSVPGRPAAIGAVRPGKDDRPPQREDGKRLACGHCVILLKEDNVKPVTRPHDSFHDDRDAASRFRCGTLAAPYRPWQRQTLQLLAHVA